MAKAKKRVQPSLPPAGGRHADFFSSVFSLVKEIPRGRVTSYGAIAAALGTRSSARTVGWAMNAAHLLPDVPAHRVVNRNGMLTGKMHFDYPEQMQERLEGEGVQVVDDAVQNFTLLFWDPVVELGL